MSEKVYIGLGGNVGEVETAFANTLGKLADMSSCSQIWTSRMYRTEPWGLVNQPDFFNLVAEFNWTESAQQLLDQVWRIEKAEGRYRSSETRWGPRLLDIDILIFGSTALQTSNLTIPHPRMRHRRFVLEPMMDLAPDLVPPGWDYTISRALEFCEDMGECRPVTASSWDKWKQHSGNSKPLKV